MATITPVVMPKWGLAMQEGTVVGWHAAPGARVEKGQDLLDIETSKIANLLEAPASGRLRRVLAREGETLPVGALLAVIAEENVSEEEIDRFVEAFEAQRAREAPAAEKAVEPVVVEAGRWRFRLLEAGPGDAPPVLFLHGFGGDLSNWSLIQAALAPRWRTLAPDLPGHGGSSKALERGDLAELADALEALIHGLGLDRLHLVGHSLGGALAVELAVRDPERVLSLALLAPAGFGPDIAGSYIEGFLRERRPRKLRPVLEMLVADATLVGREMVEEVLRFKRLDGALEALTRIAARLHEGDRQRHAVRERFLALPMPRLVIWGAEDRILPSGHLEGLAPAVEILRLEDCGHLPQIERPEQVCAALERLFREAR